MRYAILVLALALAGCSAEIRLRSFQGPYQGFTDTQATMLVAVVKLLEAGLPDDTIVLMLQAEGYSDTDARALLAKARIALRVVEAPK